eukprot:COSAG01_NODE_16_length_40091_cov_15.728646_9_plen_121_part_00
MGTPTAPGVALASLNRAAQGASAARELHCGASSNVTGFSFVSMQGVPRGFWLVNAGPYAAGCAAEAGRLIGATGQVLGAAPTKWVASLDDLHMQAYTVVAGDPVEVAPYTIVWAVRASYS